MLSRHAFVLRESERKDAQDHDYPSWPRCQSPSDPVLTSGRKLGGPSSCRIFASVRCRRWHGRPRPLSHRPPRRSSLCRLAPSPAPDRRSARPGNPPGLRRGSTPSDQEVLQALPGDRELNTLHRFRPDLVGDVTRMIDEYAVAPVGQIERHVLVGLLTGGAPSAFQMSTTCPFLTSGPNRSPSP